MTFTAHQNLLLYDRRVIFEAHSKIRLSGVPLEGKALVTITPHFIWPTSRGDNLDLVEKLNLRYRPIEPDYLFRVISKNVFLIDHTGNIIWDLVFERGRMQSVDYYSAYYSDQRQKWVAKDTTGVECVIDLNDGTLSDGIVASRAFE